MIKTLKKIISSILLGLFILPSLSFAVVTPIDSIDTASGQVAITNTDDNTNETFILKSDKKVYSGSGNFDMILSVTNTRADEYGVIQLKYNKGETLNSVSEYVPVQQLVTVPIENPVSTMTTDMSSSSDILSGATLGSTTTLKTVDTWNSVTTETRQVKTNVLQKQFAGKYDSKQARYLFKTGTTFLKLNISFNNYSTFKDEFAVELFGDNGGYGLLDPLITNLVAYWKLDESSGNAADSVGTNTLTNNNTVTYGAGLIGNAASVPGSNTNKDFTIPATVTDLNSNAAWSISFWFKTTTAAIGFISTRTDASAHAQWNIMYYYTKANSAILFEISPANSSTNRSSYYNSAGPALNDGNWHHVVWTKTSSRLTSGAHIYIDGVSRTVADDSTNNLSTNAPTGTTGALFSRTATIGSYISNASLDEFGIWTRELTSAEVTSLYNGGAGFQYPFITPTGLSTVKYLRTAAWSTIKYLKTIANASIKGYRGNN